jgi:hypothetical protein
MFANPYRPVFSRMNYRNQDLGVALLDKAETPDTFTRHLLPIPGAYFAKRESQKSMTVATSKSGKGVGNQKQLASKIEKKSRSASSLAAKMDL